MLISFDLNILLLLQKYHLAKKQRILSKHAFYLDLGSKT